MPNVIRVQVDNAAELLNAGMYDAGAIIRLQSSATEAGAYSNVTTAALVSGTSLYTLYDQAGASSTWYRTRYENAGGTVTSDWSAAFQAGAVDTGLLCSLPDVTERLFGSATVGTSDQETLLDIMREVSSAIEHYTGRWLRPRPLSGTATYRLHTTYGNILRIPQGIRSVSTLGIAATDQPSSGGTYATATSTTYYLDPPEMERDAGWPALSLRFIPSSGATFYTATFGAEITGAFGFASTPPDIAGVAIEATTRRYIGKETAAPAVMVGPAGGVRLLASLSPDSRAILDSYRIQPV